MRRSVSLAGMVFALCTGNAFGIQPVRLELAEQIRAAQGSYLGDVKSVECAAEKVEPSGSCDIYAYRVLVERRLIRFSARQVVQVGSRAIFFESESEEVDGIAMQVETVHALDRPTRRLVSEEWVMLPSDYAMTDIPHLEVNSDNCALRKDGSLWVGPNVCRYQAAVRLTEFMKAVSALRKK